MSTNEFTVWALASTAPEWIEWCEVGKADTIEKARDVGANCGWKYWRVRKTSEIKPSYLCDGMDDGKWVE